MGNDSRVYISPADGSSYSYSYSYSSSSNGGTATGEPAPRGSTCFCCACVSTSEIGIVQRLGRFSGIARPGINFICWPISSIVATISTRVQQLDVRCETKTKDNVFVNVIVSVQYMALTDKVYDAYYKLTDPQGQIKSYVYDSVRSTLPRMELDAAFEAKDQIADAVKENLSSVMDDFGYSILRTLVTDMDPDRRVKDAMNEINASKRIREAASHKAEADKILQVKAAEAEAESKYLSGLGVARQRQAIVAGLRDSISEFGKEVEGASPHDAMNLLLLTQYFDALSAIGSSSKTSTIFIPHDPGSVGSISSAMRDGLLQGGAAKMDR